MGRLGPADGAAERRGLPAWVTVGDADFGDVGTAGLARFERLEVVVEVTWDGFVCEDGGAVQEAVVAVGAA